MAGDAASREPGPQPGSPGAPAPPSLQREAAALRKQFEVLVRGGRRVDPATLRRRVAGARAALRDAGSPQDPAERARRLAARRREARDRLARLAIVLVATSVLSPALSELSPTKAYVVASGSMEPTIPTGSLAIAGPGEPRVGEVIVYWSPVGAHLIHRVVEIRQIGDATYYVPRGDANDGTDSFVVPAKDVVGVYVRHVPYMGYLWLMPLEVQAVLFTALLGLYLAITAWDAREVLRARRTLGALGLTIVLLLPTGLGAVAPVMPSSELTADVATTPLPMAAGSSPHATASVSSDQNRATVTAPAPKLWKEIPMWNCKRDQTCVLAVSSNGYSEDTGSWARITAADYSPAPTFFFEAVMKAGAGGTTYAILRDKSGAADVAGSELSTTSTSHVVVRSGPLTLSGDKDYTIRTKKATADGELLHARLVLVQQFPTKTVEHIRLSQGVDNAATAWAVPTRATKWRYDGSSTDGVTAAYFEVVAEVDGNMLTDSYVRLMDRTTATEVARVTVSILDTSATRFRSADIKASLVDGREYEIETQRGTGLVNDKLKLYSAKVLVLQSSFTKTVRYVDLSWTTTTTSTSYADAGYQGRYHMDTEWGGAQGYFEATLKNSAGGSTTSARLWDHGAGAAVASSEVSVTGTTLTRARSGAINLNANNVTYAAQLKASANTAEIRQAWLIVHQGDGKTYDHALKTKNDVANGCTWSFVLRHASGTNLARLAKATLSIRGDDALQDQVKVAGGSVTQQVGTAVTVAWGGQVQHVVQTNPTSAGTSTLETDLEGTCVGKGIRTVQRVTFQLT